MGTEKLAISDDMVHRLTQARRKRYYDAQEAMNALRARRESGEKIDHNVMRDQAKKVLKTDIAAGKSDIRRMMWQAKDRSGFKPHDPNWRAKARAKKVILPAAALLAAAGGAYALHRRRKKKKAETAKEAGFVFGMEKAAVSKELGTRAGQLRLLQVMSSPADKDRLRNVAKGIRSQQLVSNLLARREGRGGGKSQSVSAVMKDMKKIHGQRPKGPTTPRKPARLGDETRQ